MIFGRRGFIERSRFSHYLTIYTVASLQRSVLVTDSLYRATAIYRRTRFHRQLRSGRWNRRIPSIQRAIDGLGGHVDRLIVAHGLSAEKLVYSDPLTPAQRGLTTLAQLALASVAVVLIWLNWPSSAAAPIMMDRPQSAPSAAITVDAEDELTAQVIASAAVLDSAVVLDSAETAVEIVVEESVETSVVLTDEELGVQTLQTTVTANSSDDSLDAAATLSFPRYSLPLSVNTIAPLLGRFAEGSTGVTEVAESGVAESEVSESEVSPKVELPPLKSSKVG